MQSKYIGLRNTLKSIEFVHNLGILYDGLTELSDLSIELQKRDQSFVNAHKSIKRTIRVLNSMANTNGPRHEEVFNACKIQMFKVLYLNIKIL